MSERVVAFAGQLRDYAEHFAMRDWNYTRQTNIKHIRYEGDWSGYNNPVRRFGRALVAAFGPKRGLWEAIGADFGWRDRLVALRVNLRTEDHSPDGVLDGGAIITQWEETGEYLQYVQPSVGSLLADWMEAEPDNPHAERIADEMKRINDAYGDRLRTEGDDDEA